MKNLSMHVMTDKSIHVVAYALIAFSGFTVGVITTAVFYLWRAM